MGYRFLAMSTSDNTHQIPVEKFGDKDYRSILADLENFVCPKSRGDLPPVFAKVSKVLSDDIVVLSSLHCDTAIAR